MGSQGRPDRAHLARRLTEPARLQPTRMHAPHASPRGQRWVAGKAPGACRDATVVGTPSASSVAHSA
jgi:hypothetical protein